ncbi:hypothetical protein LHU53_12895 [Rhodoferax sp. U2-2l]|uniref:hypothetical protein n=1 Tax=Rhodoferax sp. U2-2l TaxID=2884000 RepID=UPI001D0A825C|nr:hypothetical protein [Rhodoferax sp. U2-2l]MCB8747801.1 hypothetical protein [Rhodoferax sp. U2-2l]
MIWPQLVRLGAVVIDYGINRLQNRRIVGDVDFEAVKKKTAWINSGPGCVGTMTVTMLIKNYPEQCAPTGWRGYGDWVNGVGCGYGAGALMGLTILDRRRFEPTFSPHT